MTDEVSFVRVVGGNCSVQIARIKQIDPETVGVECGKTGNCSGSTREGFFRGAAGKRNNGIGDAVVDAVKNAADRTGIIDDAIWLAALNHGQTGKSPSIGELAFQSRSPEECRQFVVIGEIDDMLAVEIREAIAGAQIEGVIAVVKQSERALFVGGVGVGIRKTDLQAVTHTLLDVSLQSVIGGDACGGIRLGFRGVTDIGNAKIDVSAFKGLLVRLAVGKVDRWVGEGRVFSDDGISVGVVLLKLRALEYGTRRRGDAGLIEGQRDDFVAAKIADVTDVDDQIVARLPLNVESLIHRIRQFVGTVVVGEGE